MDFDTLNRLIPHTLGEKLHVLTMNPYNAITLAMPGRHQKDTPVPGGDFVVMVDDSNMGWIKHQFTHDDLFKDIQAKTDMDGTSGYHVNKLMKAYASVVFGADPMQYATDPDFNAHFDGGIHPLTFLYAVQCLAVAEHRRYAQFEKKGGGRYLPARFSAGIVEGLWAADDCRAVQKRGRLGVEYLEKENGKPTSLKELAAV